MSDEATGKFGRTWVYCVGLVALLPMLYLFSVGPATVLLMRSTLSIDNKPWRSLYASTFGPLFFFAQMTDTEGVLRSYQGAWIRMAGHDPTVLR